MQVFLILCVILHLFYFTSSIQFKNKRRYCKNRVQKEVSRKTDVSHVQQKEEECIFYTAKEANNHLPVQQCSYDYITNGQVINPYAEVEINKDKFKSACLKCAACLAVAENVNKVFEDLYYEKLPDEHQQRSIYLCQSLRNLCLTGFKNYDLREYNGSRLITRSSISNTHVNSNMNGKWTKFLRNLCKTYIPHMDIYGLSQKYEFEPINFTEHICNSDGIFRDCGNLNLRYSEIIRTETDLSTEVRINCM